MYDKLYLYDFASFDTEDEERHTDNLSCTDKFFLRYVDGGTKGGGVGHAEREFWESEIPGSCPEAKDPTTRDIRATGVREMIQLTVHAAPDPPENS